MRAHLREVTQRKRNRISLYGANVPDNGNSCVRGSRCGGGEGLNSRAEAGRGWETKRRKGREKKRQWVKSDRLYRFNYEPGRIDRPGIRNERLENWVRGPRR